MTRSLTEIRSFDPACGGVPYNLSKWTLKRLDDAMKAFFKRAKAKNRAGFPRFRGVGRWQSFGFHQSDGLRLMQGRLYFRSGIVGSLDLKMHRGLREGWRRSDERSGRYGCQAQTFPKHCNFPFTRLNLAALIGEPRCIYDESRRLAAEFR